MENASIQELRLEGPVYCTTVARNDVYLHSGEHDRIIGGII